eukprot:CAMPEP_0185039928 /NCGR_PEP_ID=MMETSP1103-20130426/37371_1 /TAXON_ID=36769 /ORGANISM="Paraphysomonas bandaiensis, Strain Caron Lab Isolate" /LENGTH=74 /DNA_ID=CAMNT_0027579011 /DNA_START=44 /DNA_END=264 /DNA_ORIENTATION=-
MSHPGFWQSEDRASYSTPAEDDSDYRWVLRDYEWVPAKVNRGKSADMFVATTEHGDVFDCAADDVCEDIQSLSG